MFESVADLNVGQFKKCVLDWNRSVALKQASLIFFSYPFCKLFSAHFVPKLGKISFVFRILALDGFDDSWGANPLKPFWQIYKLILKNEKSFIK